MGRPNDRPSSVDVLVAQVDVRLLDPDHGPAQQVHRHLHVLFCHRVREPRARVSLRQTNETLELAHCYLVCGLVATGAIALPHLPNIVHFDAARLRVLAEHTETATLREFVALVVEVLH